MTTRIEAAILAYSTAFKVFSPNPFGINDDALAEALENAVAAGKPIPEDFDWWSELPPDAVA